MHAIKRQEATAPFAGKRWLNAPPVQTLLAAIRRVYPDLAAETVSVCAQGDDSLALDIDDDWIFKFPRHAEAAARLQVEARLLALLAGRLTIPVPQMQVHVGPPVFSRHAKLRGEHLPPLAYAALDAVAKARLAQDLGRFYAELHGIPQDAARSAGAGDVDPWLTADQIAQHALPRLAPELRVAAQATLAAYADLPPDPLGQIYGFFDGHGWNMAFDFQRGNLAGIYDFADSGIGDRHREFIYPSLISPDLTARILTAYEGLTGLRIDRPRVALLTGVHRLWELAKAGDDLPAMQANAQDWFTQWPGPGFAGALGVVDVNGDL